MMRSEPLALQRPNRVTLFLAGLTFALASVGPVINLGGAFLSPSQLCGAILITHVLISKASGRARSAPTIAIGFLVSAFLLGAGLLGAAEISSAGIAFLNFLSGVIVAFVVGVQVGASHRPNLDMLDLGVLVFVAFSAFQSFEQSEVGSTAAELHATVIVAWGGSNYVGAVLAVVGFWLIARSGDVAKWRWLLILGAVVAIVVAVSTLSRGAVVALAAGALIVTWRAGRTAFGRVLWRLGALAVPVGAFLVMSSIVGERFEGTSADPASNIDARLVLYRLAWQQFADSPFVGTGWTALRAPSEAIFGGPISFAHNWYLSALQIAGLLAVPMLIVFTVLVFRSIRGAGLYGAPVAAAFVASMIEPVMEGYVGALVIGTILLSVYRSHQSKVAEPKTPDITGSTRGRSGARALNGRA